MAIKKGGAVGAVVVLMLCVAVYLNWSYTRTDDDLTAASDIEAGRTLGEAQLVENTQNEETSDQEETENTDTEDNGYFARARLTRQRARDEAMGILKETAADEEIQQASRDDAANALTAMATAAMREARIENLIIAKGYEDCVVSIGDTGISVVVKSPDNGLQPEDAAKIKDIVMDEASVGADQIKIIETY